jgi:hypothetical protein
MSALRPVGGLVAKHGGSGLPPVVLLNHLTDVSGDLEHPGPIAQRIDRIEEAQAVD